MTKIFVCDSQQPSKPQVHSTFQWLDDIMDKINVIIIVTSSLAAVSSSIIVVFLVVSCIKRIRRQPQPNQQVVYIESVQPLSTQQLNTTTESILSNVNPNSVSVPHFQRQLPVSTDTMQHHHLPMGHFQETHHCFCRYMSTSHEDLGRHPMWHGYPTLREEDQATMDMASNRTRRGHEDSASAKKLKSSRRLSRSVPDLSMPRMKPFLPNMPEFPEESLPSKGGSSRKQRTLSDERDPSRCRQEDVMARVKRSRDRLRYSRDHETKISQWFSKRISALSDGTNVERDSSRTTGSEDMGYVQMSSSQDLSSPRQPADTVQSRPRQAPVGGSRTSSHIYQNLPCMSSKTK
ncbi:hypothetical protein C0Q70_02519 [Pomacea canaliculata]|uniref:Uncharacterized protein n=1 Tax=Pomacea canaliculata TaxID=400727 RepID=A0A2T7PQ51_POMCA|nr:hypothetical protein C0Q70_02519 [Pomacea canaliculata]